MLRHLRSALAPPSYSLHAHLVVLVLVAVLPLAGFAGVIVSDDLRHQRDLVSQGTRDTVRALSQAVDRQVSTSWAMLETLATSPELEKDDLRAFHDLCVRVSASHANAWIVLFDDSGQQLVNTTRPFGFTLPNPFRDTKAAPADARYPDLPLGGAAPVRRVFDTGRPVASDIFIALDSGRPTIGAGIPVVRNGRVRYVLEMSMDPDSFTSLLRDQHLPPGASALILDATGLVITRIPDPDRFAGQRYPADLMIREAKADEGFGASNNLEGVPTYHAFTRSALTGWVTVVRLPRAAIDARLTRSLAILASGAAMVMLGGLAVALVLGRRISTPIALLARSATQMAQGERVALPPFASKEVRDLRDALVKAGETVREVAAERLARKVAEAAGRRASLLARATTALASSLEYEDSLRQVAALVVPELCDGCAFDAKTEDGSLRRVALSERRADAVPAVDEDLMSRFECGADRAALLGLPDGRSRIVAPIMARGAVLGMLTLVAEEGSRPAFEAQDLALAEELALRVGYAIENARFYRDVKVAYGAAEAANRTKDEFLATLSHELRTPLTAVCGWARMLRAGQVRGESVNRALDAIVRNSDAQVQLIDDLLDASRVIAGKMRLDVHPVDLKEVVEAALDALRPAATAKEVRLESALERDAAPIDGDPARLQQAVWNLLTNAVKFTPRGGEVRAHLHRRDSHAEIVISDTGQGIEPDLLRFVFDRFRQGDSSSTRAHAGLGLGLTLVKSLVELHGGSVVAQSAGRNRGATFIITLPLASADALRESVQRPARTTLDTSPIDARLEGLRILVVDDAPDALDVVSAILSGAGAAVETSSSAAAALAALQRWRPDVLVSDIEMPNEDGYSLIRKVRALNAERGGNTPAVALTACGRAEDRMLSLTAGYSMHVPKPVDPRELTTIIASLASRALQPNGP